MERDDDVAAAIVLFETPRGQSALSLRERIIRHGSPLAAITAAPHGDGARLRWDEPAVRTEARARARALAAAGGRLIVRGGPDFPSRLGDLDWGPPWLFVRGSASLPARAAAIVGTRRATPSAVAFTHALANEVAKAGFAILSGLARGIDAAAHRGALEAWAGDAEAGITVAVLGTGVDICYPAGNRPLWKAILERGLLVSELPPGTPPLRHHFPMRNRILAALGQAVVVVQAPEKSGALVTAHHAMEAGVDVLAVPGDPLLPENAGSNRLLAQGARVTVGAEDVVSAVMGYEIEGPAPLFIPGTSARGTIASASLGTRERVLLGVLDFVPRTVDDVSSAAKQSVAEVLSGLLRLELAGLVENLPGGRVRRTPRAARYPRPSP